MVVLLLAVGCSAGDDGGGADPGDDSTDSDDGTDAGDNGSEPRHLVTAISTLHTETWAQHLTNGAEATIYDMVGDTLLVANPNTREPEPGLALSWELSDDLLTWSFELRPDVPFHGDYGNLTADDVKFTWELMLREDAAHGRSGVYSNAVAGDIDNFEVVSDLEFRLHAETPQTILPSALHNGRDNLFITSRAYWDEVGEEQATAHPIGTGPFEFVEHEPGSRVTFQAVESHWRQTPHFDTVEVRIISDEAARLGQVRSGELDLAQISMGLIPEAEAAGVRTISVLDVGHSNIFFGGMYPEELNGETFPRASDAPWIQDDAPEQGRAIREALSLAIDRESIVDNLLLGQGTPAAGPVLFMPGDYAFTDPNWEVPPYDPDRARDLLSEGGYPDGFEVDFPIFAQAGRPASEIIAEAVAGMWEEIGITVNRMPMEYSPTFVDLTLERDTATWAYQYSRSFSDEPGESFQACCWPTGVFWVYHDAILEKVPEMMAEPDYQARMAIAREIADALIEDVTAIPIASADTPYVVGDRIDEWTFVNGSIVEIHNVEYITPTN